MKNLGNSILAKAFAHANDFEQAAMLNTMARELYVICKSHRHPWTFDSQVCSISKYLNEDGVALIRELYEFIQVRQEKMLK